MWREKNAMLDLRSLTLAACVVSLFAALAGLQPAGAVGLFEKQEEMFQLGPLDLDRVTAGNVESLAQTWARVDAGRPTLTGAGLNANLSVSALSKRNLGEADSKYGASATRVDSFSSGNHQSSASTTGDVPDGLYAFAGGDVSGSTPDGTVALGGEAYTKVGHQAVITPTSLKSTRFANAGASTSVDVISASGQGQAGGGGTAAISFVGSSGKS